MNHGKILKKFKAGKMSAIEAINHFRGLHYEELGFSKVDHRRSLMKGFPEVIFCKGKTPEQVAKIFSSLASRNAKVLATKATKEMFTAVKSLVSNASFNESAGIVYLSRDNAKGKGLVLVVTGGTSDIPVAEEAAITAEVMGNRVERLYDVGVAGIHRLSANKSKLLAAKVIIVVAGMEGALASVVSGLTDKPVIAVPTSVGYGASFEGLAALLAMLNSCSPGMAVVNIDNGFGAGFFASLINK